MTPLGTLWRRFRELYASRQEPEALRPLATLVWRTILALFFLGSVVVVVYAMIVFGEVVEKVNTIPPTNKPAAALDRTALDQTIREIRERGVFLDISPVDE